MTLEELANDILQNVDKTTKDYLRKPDGPIALHFSLGMWIRNKYKLWDDSSDNYKFFASEYGLTHADDMSGILMNKMQKMLQSKDYDPLPDVARYKEHWKKYES